MSELIDVKKTRERNNLTQKQFAELCGVTLRTVQNWEAGRVIPDAMSKLLRSLVDSGAIVSPDHTNMVKQHVVGNSNKLSGVGSVSDGIPTAVLQQALNEVTEMRKLLAESLHNINDLSQRIMTILESQRK